MVLLSKWVRVFIQGNVPQPYSNQSVFECLLKLIRLILLFHSDRDREFHRWGSATGNVLARVVVQAPSTISFMDIRRELHWLPVYYRISCKLILLSWKALHTAEPFYLSELTRTLRSVNTGLLVLPTGVTSHFASRSFSVSSRQSGILYLHTSVLLIISLHLSAVLNHTFSS